MLIKQELSEQLSKLKETAAEVLKSISEEPEGRISVKHVSKNHNEYYFHNKGSDSGSHYIPLSDIGKVSSLLQKRYNHKVLKKIIKQINLIEGFIKEYDESAVKDAFEQFDVISQKYMHAYDYPDDLFVKKWSETKYESNPYPMNENNFTTLRNEIVRSKSEVIIANCLGSSGIPYKYECPLSVANNQVIYPDFTILNKKTREIFYWEHFGKMDSDEYRSKAFRRIDTYASLGIFPGKSLILTFEDYKTPMNVYTVKRIIEAFF